MRHAPNAVADRDRPRSATGLSDCGTSARLIPACHGRAPFRAFHVVLTAVPPSLRPTTDAPHDVEHAAPFLIVGFLFGLAYEGRERILSVGAVVFCAMVEVSEALCPRTACALD